MSGENKGSRAKVLLEKTDINLRICISYLLYPGLPVIRKKIEFINNSSKEMKLEATDIEWLRFEGSESCTECWVIHDYARQKSLGQFIGNWYDPIVVVHEADKRRGIVLGNEAPGVMKRTTAFCNPTC